jgi:hypothetical protein
MINNEASVQQRALELLEQANQKIVPVEIEKTPHVIIAQLQEEVAATIWGTNNG